MRKFELRKLLIALIILCAAMGLWASGSEEAAAADEGGVTVVNIWTKFNDTNPQNSQDEWLAATIATLKVEKNLELKNTFVPYDQINSKVNLAVQAGGDVPDVSYLDGQIDFHVNNGTVMDLTTFVKNASWYKDINPTSLKGTTALDGNIYALPSLLGGSTIYYWTAAYPDGPPKTTDDVLASGARLAKDGKYAITFKGSEGTGSSMFYFNLVASFGGTYTNEKGETVFASEGTVKAIEFLRELFANKYAPEVSLGAGFDFETPFKDGNAGAFVAGAWSYVYLNPLTSPDGKVYDNGALSVEAALRDGSMAIADPISAPGGKPCNLTGGFGGWGIPVGSKNVKGAEMFLDFIMQPENAADFAMAYGGLPTNMVAMKDPRFVDSLYWQAVNQSVIRTTSIAQTMNKNPKLMQKFNDVVITLIQKPNLDIMTELVKAQKDLNSGY